jgi:hypothetical protein
LVDPCRQHILRYRPQHRRSNSDRPRERAKAGSTTNSITVRSPRLDPRSPRGYRGSGSLKEAPFRLV